MNLSKATRLFPLLFLGHGPAFVLNAQADQATYTLENVVLDDANAVMTGTFVWTYDAGDFENGAGQFTFLDIPFTGHDHTDLDAVIDVGGSIEITLAGSVHDDGVDITLFLLQPLTPTTSALVDIARSKYEIGGNGFHVGAFLSGEIVSSAATGVEDGAGLVPASSLLAIYPNPFNPRTTVTYFVTRSGPVDVSVYDPGGRLVTTLASGWHSSGRYSAAWNGGATGSGVYFVRCVSGAETRTQKAVLIR